MDVDLPAGVVKGQSEATAIGRYIDSDHVRFVGSKPQKIGGWVKHFETQLLGVPRNMHAFLGPGRVERIGIGTEQKLYLVDYEGVVSDITPFREVLTLGADPFASTIGSAIVTVTDPTHDAEIGDTVHFSGATPFADITIAGEYLVTGLVDADHYQITHSSLANATATGGGAAVEASYEVGVGPVDPAESDGYGVGPYGMEDYGTPRSVETDTLNPRFWSLDHYGALLVAAFQRSRVYWYDDDIHTRAEIVPNSPADVLSLFVTEERFIITLCEDMWIKWPDRDDPEDWTPHFLNTANARRLSVGSVLMNGAVLGGGVSVIWTDVCIYRLQFTGGEFVYDSIMVAEQCGLVSPGAFCTADGIAFWMSRNGFHMYGGGAVLAIPNADAAEEWVFTHMDEGMRVKSTAYYNSNFREVWFIYPSLAASEPDRYAMVNIDGWHWSFGTLARVGSTVQTGAAARPLLSSPDGYVYEHEVGVDADGLSLPTLLETGLYRLDEAHTIDIFGFAPDFERQTGSILLTVTGKNRPQSATSDIDTNTLEEGEEMADVRVAGRYFKFKLQQDAIGADWQLGLPVLEVQPGGERR